jgi:hypothetical protein
MRRAGLLGFLESLFARGSNGLGLQARQAIVSVADVAARVGNLWMSVADVTRALHVHEMELPLSTELLGSGVVVGRDGDRARVRGAVIVTLAR